MRSRLSRLPPVPMPGPCKPRLFPLSALYFPQILFYKVISGLCSVAAYHPPGRSTTLATSPPFSELPPRAWCESVQFNIHSFVHHPPRDKGSGVCAEGQRWQLTRASSAFLLRLRLRGGPEDRSLARVVSASPPHSQSPGLGVGCGVSRLRPPGVAAGFNSAPSHQQRQLPRLVTTNHLLAGRARRRRGPRMDIAGSAPSLGRRRKRVLAFRLPWCQPAPASATLVPALTTAGSAPLRRRLISRKTPETCSDVSASQRRSDCIIRFRWRRDGEVQPWRW